MIDTTGRQMAAWECDEGNAASDGSGRERIMR